MKEKNGFTLAEAMIVLVVLGVIATLTVPALIQKQRETANRTKIKKAMTVYDTAINKMVIENGIKSNEAFYMSDNSFAPEGNCTNTAPYFKVSENAFESGEINLCRFKTSDGLWWDISKINNPLLAFSEDDLDDTEKSYQLVAHYDNNGILRVDDLAYEIGGANENALTKVYNFINNVKEEECTTNECKIEKYKNTRCETTSDSSVCPDCKSCIHDMGSGYELFDENGRNIISYYNNCGNGSPISNCYNTSINEYNSAGQQTMYKWGCDRNGENCTGSWVYEYNDAGKMTLSKHDCDGNGIRCQDCSVAHGGGGKCVWNSHGYYDPEDTVYDD